MKAEYKAALADLGKIVRDQIKQWEDNKRLDKYSALCNNSLKMRVINQIGYTWDIAATLNAFPDAAENRQVNFIFGMMLRNFIDYPDVKKVLIAYRLLNKDDLQGAQEAVIHEQCQR